MSLHTLANHMSAHGRGPDSTLVHMSPREVQGLQALAMRHGGSLTINPQTGLPEAGFLSSILPLVAGIGLTAMGMPAGMAALTVGGGTAAVTGDLKKGLMAGLGAYGGASLGESLIGSGAAGLAPEVAAASLNAVPVETAAEIASAGQAGLTMPPVVEPGLSASLPIPNAADPFRLGSSVSQETLKAPVGGITSQSPNYTPPITTTPSPYSNASNATADGPMAIYGPSVSESTYPVQPPSVENMTAGQRFDALKAGATGQNLLNYAKANPLQTAGMLAGPLMAASEDNNAPSTPVGDSDRGAMANAGYEFDPGWSDPTPAPDPFGREQVYNRPRYRIPKKAAHGGAVQHFDVGGTVDGFNQTPALNKFVELQAARAAQTAPEQIDVKQQFADYLKAQSVPIAGTTSSSSSSSSSYKPPVMERLPAPAALSTAGISALMPESVGSSGTRGGLSFEAQQIKDDQDAWANLGEDGQAAYFAVNPGMLGFHEGALNIWSKTPFGIIQNYFDPSRQDKQRAMIANARGRIAADKVMQGQGFVDSISGSSGAAPGSSPFPAPGADNDINPGWGSRDAGGMVKPTAEYTAAAQAEKDARITAFDTSREGSRGGGGGMGGEGGGGSQFGGGLSAQSSETRSALRDGSGYGGGVARGGLLDSRYAYGGGIAALNQGGMYNLGSYSDGGRLLRGPGDGVSDSIPAVIGQKQPARLADGEFVIPARIVSEIGNGSTQAGARKLYAMMDKVQRARRATVGKGKVAKNTRADKYLPA